MPQQGPRKFFAAVALSLCLASAAIAAVIPGELGVAQSVTAAGASSSQIPIPALPGAGGLEPKLVLSYSSQGGNNGLGLGWSIGGFSIIARGSKTLEVDGSPEAIAFTADDAFYLDGMRLVPVANIAVGDTSAPKWLANSYGAIKYRKWIDDGTLAFGLLSSAGALNSFIAESKTGLRTEFSVQVAGSPALHAPAVYLPARTIDTAGNYIDWQFTIAGLNYQLLRVEYTGLAGAKPRPAMARIDFNYETAPLITTHLLGQAAVRGERLKSVVSTLINGSGAAGQGLTLVLTYTDANSADAYYLTSAQLNAFQDTVAPVSFEYLKPEPQWIQRGSLAVPATPITGGGRSEFAYRVGVTWDANRHPTQGLFVSRATNGRPLNNTYVRGANGWATAAASRAPPAIFADSAGHSADVFLMDLDGDGYTDIVQSGAGGKGSTWIQTQDANDPLNGHWTLDPNHKDPGESFLEADLSPRVVQTVNLGDKPRPDLLVREKTGNFVALLNQPSGWKQPAALKFSVDPSSDVVFGDFNCDGVDDRVSLQRTGTDWVLQTFAGSQTAWTPLAGGNWDWRTPTQNTVRLRSINVGNIGSPKCRAILVSVRTPAGAETLTVLAGSPSGWTALSVTAPGPLFTRSDGSPLYPEILDINGDGLDDVVLSQTDSAGNLTQDAWIESPRPNIASPVVFTRNSQFYPPVPIADQNGRFSDTLVLTPASFGAAAIMTLPSARNTIAQTFLATPSGWQKYGDLTPAPVAPLVQSKQRAGALQFVDLNGDGMQDAIFNDGGSNIGALLNSPGGGWTAAPGFAPPLALQMSGDVGQRATLIDVNGDGYIDLVYAYRENGQDVLKVFLNGIPYGVQGWLPSNDARAAPWVPPKAMSDVSRGDLGWRFADINGDGLPDLIYGSMDNSLNVTASAYLNSRSGWGSAVPGFALPAAFVFDQGDGFTLDLGTQLIDIDGARLPALVASYRDPIHPNSGWRKSGIFINVAGQFATASSRSLPTQIMLDAPYFDSASVSFIDIDGDGNQDIVRFTSASADVYLGNGVNWDSVPAAAWAFPSVAFSTALGFAGTRFADVNGDGRLDMIYIRQNDRGVILNTGSTWLLQAASVSALPDLPFETDDGNSTGVLLMDVSGDGAPDLVKPATDSSGQTWINPGKRAGMLSKLSESSGVTTSFTYVRLVDPPLSDKNAPAKPIFTRTAAGLSYPVIALTPFSPVVGQSITDEGNNRTVTSTYHYNDFRFDLLNARVLGFARIERTDETSDASYFTTHATDFLQDPYLAGHPRLEQVSVTDNGAPVIVDSTSKRWTLSRVTVPPDAKGRAFSLLQIVLSETANETHDLTGGLTSAIKTKFEYDDWLNTITMTVEKPGRATQTLVNTYTGAQHARYGRLDQSVSTVASAAGVVSNSRTAAFLYDDQGPNPTLLLTSEALDVGDPELNSSTTYRLNERGDIELTTKTAFSNNRSVRNGKFRVPSVGGPRSNKVKYDATGRLIVARWNAKKQKSAADYQPNSIGFALGLPTTETDPNSLDTSKGYDALGRLLHVKTPDGVSRLHQRLLASQVPAEWLADLARSAPRKQQKPKRPRGARSPAAWLAPAIGHAEADTVTGTDGNTRLEAGMIWDRRGHLIRTVVQRTDGSQARFVFKDSHFDVQGRLVAQSLPFFSGDTAYWTTFEYNALGHKTKEARPDGGTITFEYMGLTRRRTDAKGYVSTVTLNLDQKPSRITRADGGIVEFNYDDMGRVIGVKSPSGLRSVFQYDGAGNRTINRDPNAGEIDYRYDAFGELREERAGNQQWAELDYDELGRSYRQWRPDQEIDWTYDAAGAVGLPASVSLARQNSGDALTYAEKYDYDAAGRLHRTVAQVAANATSDPLLPTNFTGTYSFDYGPFSELSHVSYPISGGQSTPLQIDRYYDAKTGQLVQVLDSSTGSGRTLWRLTAADASGRPLGDTLGNGAREAREFQSTTGRLATMRVFSSQTATLMADAYTYDLNGNLASRGTIGSSPDETFGYDKQNRLTVANERNHQATKVLYDQDDRIRFKSDVGNYHYASDASAAKFGCIPNTPPDALCAIERSGSVSEKFGYDEFGDMTSRDSQFPEDRDSTVSYTFDHHVARIAAARGFPDAHGSVEFYYGPSGQRVLSREMSCDDAFCFNRRSKETVHMGLYDRITVRHGTGLGSSRLVTDRFYVVADQGVFVTIDAIDRRYANNGDEHGPGSAELYQHHDHLGSIVMLTKADGRVGTRIHFDPWGKASSALDPHEDHNTKLGTEAAWTYGFTGQDHIPEFALIHMTGRVYDPRLGVFLSVDPLGGNSDIGGDLNPYLYAEGNPLAITDPTGYWGLGDIINDIGNAIGNAVQSIASAVVSAVTTAIQNAAQWVGQNWREIVTVAVIAIVTVATSGAAGPVVAAMAAGAAGGATETALYGGNLQDVVTAGIEGGVEGLLSGGIGASGLGWEGRALAQGFVSGVESQFNGQSFERGFVIGSLSRLNPGLIDAGDNSGWAVAERVAARAVVNGAISEAQGDKFANGALTGAFQQLYMDADQGQWRIKSLIESISIFKPGLPQDFGVADLLRVYGNIQDQILDRGIRYLGGVGEPNTFLDKLQFQYNQLMNFGAQVDTIKNKNAIGAQPPPPPDWFSMAAEGECFGGTDRQKFDFRSGGSRSPRRRDSANVVSWCPGMLTKPRSANQSALALAA